MKNNFSRKTKDRLPRYCMACGKTNEPLEDHHIKGRKNGLHSSSFNAVRICKLCHSSITQNDDSAARLFEITYRYLIKNRYKASDKDLQFIEKYINLFNKFIWNYNLKKK